MAEATDQQRRVGARMRQAARAKGLNPYDVAERLGVRPPTVYRWYQGARPGAELLQAFADLVGEPVAAFYAEADETRRQALDLLVAWADRLMGGASVAGAMQLSGLPIEDVPTPALLGLVAGEESLREALRLASGGHWEALSAEQRRALVERLTTPPPEDGSPAGGSGGEPTGARPGRRRKA
jgi:AcrR family transcriptional regulator